MTWSPVPPTVPGFYWWDFHGAPQVVEVAFDYDEKDRARAERPGAPLYQYETGVNRAVRVTQKLGKWWGPLERPPEPQP